MVNKNIVKKIKVEYELLLKSGIFWEIYPELTGNWNKDYIKFIKVFKSKRKIGE